jgi:hypothetical protein
MNWIRGKIEGRHLRVSLRHFGSTAIPGKSRAEKALIA